MPHAPLPNDVGSPKALVIAQRAALEAAQVTLLSRDVEIESCTVAGSRLSQKGSFSGVSIFEARCFCLTRKNARRAGLTPRS